MDMESKDNREKTSRNGLEVAIKHKCLSLFIFVSLFESVLNIGLSIG